jgi:photosystem II stability/assembly factor-like uncharacterized protein
MARLLSILLSLAFVACSATKSAPLRDDEPGAAAEYHAMRRAGTGDPQRAYAVAREAMRRMPRYSTASDTVRLPGRQIEVNDVNGRPFDRWQPLGPGNIGGRTRALIVDPVEPRVLYAAGVSGGVWKSVSGGERWEPVADDMVNIAVSSLAMDPEDHNTIYAGTGEGFYREEVRGTGLPLRGNGIFVTRDAGETWAQLASTAGEDFHWVNDVVVTKSSLYAATRTGVWRSRDDGATWTRVLATTVRGGCLDLESRTDTESDFLFASCGTFERATVYRATDANSDAPWEPVLSHEQMGRTALAVAPSNQSIIYALAASNESGNYNQGLLAVFRSENGGAAGSWQTVATNAGGNYDQKSLLLTNPFVAQQNKCASPFAADQFVNMGWYCNIIAVDPIDPNRVWAGGVDLFRSDDGGKNWGIASYWWTQENVPSFVHADQHRITFHPGYDGVTNKTMFIANDGGIYRTDDARAATGFGEKAVCEPNRSQVTFRRLNRNYGVTQFYHGAVFADGRRFIGGTQDNGTIIGNITDGIDGWQRVAGGDGGYVAIDPVNESIIYAASQVGNLLKTGPGPIAFRSAKLGLNDAFLFITPFVLDPNKRERLWTGGWYMWRSDISAEGWNRASSQLPGRVSAIAVAPGRPDRVVAGTHNGWIVRSDAATVSSIVTQWNSMMPREGFVSSITFDPADPNIVYATYAGFGGSHLWRSADGGATWSAIGPNLPDIPLHSLAIDPTRPGRLYLGTDLGVFVSLDNGATWNVENTGFANAVTETVVIAKGSRGPAVYAFTHGRGAWRAELVALGEKRRSVR